MLNSTLKDLLEFTLRINNKNLTLSAYCQMLVKISQLCYNIKLIICVENREKMVERNHLSYRKADINA